MELSRRDATPLANDLGRAFLASMWTEFALCTIILAARYYTRGRIVRKSSADDICMLIGYLLALAFSIICTVSVNFGMGRHLGDLDNSSAIEALKYGILGHTIAVFSKIFSRIGWALTLYALLSPQQRRPRIFLQVIIAIQILVNLSYAIYIYAQCQPIARAWDHDVLGTCLPLIGQEYFGFAEGSINAANDFTLAVLPAFVIWNLQLKRSVKLSLILTIGLGTFAGMVSIVKTVYLKSITDPDFTYERTNLLIWSSLESYLLMIASSLPTLRPLFARLDLTKRSILSGRTPPWSKNRTTRSVDDRERELRTARADSDQIELTHVTSAVPYGTAELEEPRIEADRSYLAEEHGLGIMRTVEVSIH